MSQPLSSQPSPASHRSRGDGRLRQSSAQRSSSRNVPKIQVLFLLLAVSTASAQTDPGPPSANPGRPTVATPATLTPTGYLQFETGYLAAWTSPGLSSQHSTNEVVKFSLAPRLELIAGWQPFAYSTAGTKSSTDQGGVSLGVQAVLYRSERLKPTIAVSYFRSVYGATSPDLDIGSYRNSLLLLGSGDAKGFHYDINFFLNEVVDTAKRAQFGQALSISHSLGGKFGVAGELWHFTQPFLRANTVGNLWTVNYNARKNLVFDAGFNRGLTTTSTRWEIFTGFTYLLPHKLEVH